MEEENSGQILNEIKDSKKAAKKIFPVPPELENIIYPPVWFMLDHHKTKDLIGRPFSNGTISIYFLFENSATLYNEQFKEIKISSSFIVGLYKLEKSYFINIKGKLNAIVISLKPGSFRKLFQVSCGMVENGIIDLNNFVPATLQNHLKLICSNKNIDEKLQMIMMFMQILLIQKVKENDDIYKGALDLINEFKCKITINDLCSKLYVSKRNFERSFHLNVGIAPKEYIRIVRVNFIFDHLIKNSFINWPEIIYDFGYYDQSHFIHEFKLVTGCTPSEFINIQKIRMIYTNQYYLIQNLELFKSEYVSKNI